MEEKEKDGTLGYDADVHAFLASCIHEGLAESPATQLIMRILGLEVSVYFLLEGRGGISACGYRKTMSRIRQGGSKIVQAVIPAP